MRNIFKEIHIDPKKFINDDNLLKMNTLAIGHTTLR